ncbi:glycosyltransferase family protein [Filimonas effusa]|uniref:Glycosyltransferase family 2 protein n=1 Tax=Filimonas effusa TaxID=2508721 RepID=A0A4V1M9F7_9BACT|nr:glycosyltransferase family 2 protein [Filimonas effusa]RXK80942.1 glycosyltransferase family 2 protein [Filimonas effusa]
MKISGFTIIKNAVISDYPIVEAIRSVLPVVDEMVVLVGDCNDGTRELIASIGDPKIKIFDSVWDQSLRQGGKVLAAETDKAFQLIAPDADWAFYIQGDEVAHEDYYRQIREACMAYKDDKSIDGLVFNYVHFYGTYRYIGDSRKWYNKEIRIIKNDKSITAYRDAQGFRRNGKKIKCKLIDAYIYHYGWVKSPAQMKKKMKESAKYWLDNDTDLNNFLQSEDIFNFDEFDSIEVFKGKHPAVMQQRVASQSWTIELDTSRKRFSFKKWFLYKFEKLTGIRLFSFRNYTT